MSDDLAGQKPIDIPNFLHLIIILFNGLNIELYKLRISVSLLYQVYQGKFQKTIIGTKYYVKPSTYEEAKIIWQSLKTENIVWQCLNLCFVRALYKLCAFYLHLSIY